MSEEKMVSIFNPFANAYCQVKLSVAQKFLEGVDEIKQRVEAVEVEEAKDKAYNESLKKVK
ncbi:MAG: hypothetical protein WC906_04220 [Parcubacteria group bacterium]|jgi:hypothetical protein